MTKAKKSKRKTHNKKKIQRTPHGKTTKTTKTAKTSKIEDKIICYDGIGSNKTGNHTEKEFLQVMNKNKNNSVWEPPPNNLKTTDQWVKWAGATRGRCKTKKKPFKLSDDKIEKICKKNCDKGKKKHVKLIKTTNKLIGKKISKIEIDIAVKEFSDTCERVCIELMKNPQKVEAFEKRLSKVKGLLIDKLQE